MIAEHHGMRYASAKPSINTLIATITAPAKSIPRDSASFTIAHLKTAMLDLSHNDVVQRSGQAGTQVTHSSRPLIHAF
jgi:hypothetical protein